MNPNKALWEKGDFTRIADSMRGSGEALVKELGITNGLDVTLAARELEALDARIAPLEARATAAKYALAVLVGEYPEGMVEEL